MELTRNNATQMERAFEARRAKVQKVQIIEDTDCMFKAPPLVKLEEGKKGKTKKTKKAKKTKKEEKAEKE